MRFILILISLPLMSVFLANQGHTRTLPVCLSSSSDSDNDGYGWENSQSCKVAVNANPLVNRQSGACVDPDGDGYGWDGVQTCIPGSPTVATNTAPLQPAPVVQVQSVQGTTELLPPFTNPGNSLPYPARNGFQIKSIQPDFWTNRSELLSADVAGISINLVWEHWQPSLSTSCSRGQIRFDGQCFTVDTVFDQEIKYWSSQGKTVTGILYGVPSWARDNSLCTAQNTDTEKFCSARDANDYARFAAMIAQRYNGLNGNGRIADFVIHNEVNMNQWYKVGCGAGIACDQNNWIADYSANYNAAYDRITAIQPAAKVLVPFAHQFETNFDDPSGSNPIISVKTFLRGLHARANGRKWRVAYHPYHKNLDSAVASYDDLPRVTFGNIGVLVGWLRQEFPGQPEAWEVHLTENGISSNGQSDEFSQNIAVCNSYRNVLGTPGIENYVYHRMQDHPAEAIHGVALGLRRQDGSAKPVWNTWSQMSDPGTLDCGFENLPYTKLTSFMDNRGNYRASSRVVGGNFSEIDSWYPLRAYQADTYMAYECNSGNSSYVSTDKYCAGDLSYGPIGYVHQFDGAGRTGLFTCSGGGNYYSSSDFNCGGDTVIEFIGYVRKFR